MGQSSSSSAGGVPKIRAYMAELQKLAELNHEAPPNVYVLRSKDFREASFDFSIVVRDDDERVLKLTTSIGEHERVHVHISVRRLHEMYTYVTQTLAHSENPDYVPNRHDADEAEDAMRMGIGYPDPFSVVASLRNLHKEPCIVYRAQFNGVSGDKEASCVRDVRLIWKGHKGSASGTGAGAGAGGHTSGRGSAAAHASPEFASAHEALSAIVGPMGEVSTEWARAAHDNYMLKLKRNNDLVTGVHPAEIPTWVSVYPSYIDDWHVPPLVIEKKFLFEREDADMYPDTGIDSINLVVYVPQFVVEDVTTMAHISRGDVHEVLKDWPRYEEIDSGCLYEVAR
jgi:hypothetical protein